MSTEALQILFGKERRRKKAQGNRGVKMCRPALPPGVAVARPDDEEMPDAVQPEKPDEVPDEVQPDEVHSELGSPEQSEISSEGSDEAQDGGHDRRHKIDQRLSPSDGIFFARLAKRRGRGANSFEFEGLKFSRLYTTRSRQCRKYLHMGTDLDDETVLRRLVAWHGQAGRHDTSRNPRDAHVFSESAKNMRRRTPSP